jgi:hypothetical protein
LPRQPGSPTSRRVARRQEVELTQKGIAWKHNAATAEALADPTARSRLADSIAVPQRRGAAASGTQVGGGKAALRTAGITKW